MRLRRITGSASLVRFFRRRRRRATKPANLCSTNEARDNHLLVPLTPLFSICFSASHPAAVGAYPCSPRMRAGQRRG